MMADKYLQDLVAKKKMQEFTRQKMRRQTRGILKKKSTLKEASDEFELKSVVQDDQRDSGVADVESLEASDEQETALLLDSFEHSPSKNRLENTADSLLDIRLERMRMDVRQDEIRRPVVNDTRDDLPHTTPEMSGNRGELYCCYAIYCFMMLWVFLFALLYVWLPMLKSKKEGK